VVQQALYNASEGRTTIAIAHRLSTIRNAGKIVVMAKDKIVEQGTHDDSIKAHGEYHGLVQAQELTEQAVLSNQLSGLVKPDHYEKVELDGNALDLTRTVTKPGSVRSEETAERTFTTSELSRFSWNMKSGEHALMFLGFLFSVLAGANPAIQAIFLGNSNYSFFSPDSSTGGHGTLLWCWMFFMLGIAIWIFFFFQGATLSKASAELIARIREQAFGAILRQDMEFFDGEAVTSGSLAIFLSSEANRLARLSGFTLVTIISAVATVIIAIAVACSFGWKLALVSSACIPLMLACGYYRFHALTRMDVAIAHRLSTIQHADVIYVFDQGKIVEQGTHDELMARRKVYWELARLQDMGAPQ
jgi:ATP-binding cassette subfamily B (MDR/TAP) protein 1